MDNYTKKVICITKVKYTADRVRKPYIDYRFNMFIIKKHGGMRSGSNYLEGF
jgi:hypothetical protein